MATLDALKDVIKYQLEYNRDPSGKTPPAKEHDIARMIGLPDATLSQKPPLPPRILASLDDEEEEPSEGETDEEEEEDSEDRENDVSSGETIEPWKGKEGEISINKVSIVKNNGILVGFQLDGAMLSLEQLNQAARARVSELLVSKSPARLFEGPPVKKGDVGQFTVGTTFSDKYKFVFLQPLTEHFSLYFSNTVQSMDSNKKVQKLIVSDYPFGKKKNFKADIQKVVEGLKDHLSDKQDDLGVLLYPNWPRPS
jgi:hypothetical protein